MAVPPFERFYEQHRDEIYGFLRKRLGAERAEDAFQETFLRALRAYPRLEHGDHLRAWVYTIAGRIVIDEHRRTPPVAAELPELASRRSARPSAPTPPPPDRLPLRASDASAGRSFSDRFT